MNLFVARYVDRWVGLPLCLGLHVLGRLTGRPLPPLGATTPPAGGLRPRPRRVLGIKFYGLGNIVMILPVLRELRAAFPDVEIDFLTLPGNAPLLQRSRLVRQVLSVDVTSLPRFVRSVLALVGALRRGGYDTVLDFEQFAKISGVFGFVTGARECVGLNTEGQSRGWLYTTRVVHTDSDHTVDVFMRVVAPFGVRAGQAPPWRLPLDAADRARARAFVAAEAPGAAGPLVVMHIGTGPNFSTISLKRWPNARYAALADALVARHRATVVFTGVGPEEGRLIAETRAAMRERAIDACDRLTVGELAALVADAAFVVSNDTSVMHLAGIVGTPVVALFGPTAPRNYGPRGPHDLVFYEALYCSPCLSNYNLKVSRCTDNVCMKSLALDRVLAGIERQLVTWTAQRDDAPASAAAGGE